MIIIFFLISFLASIVGAICGVGGGVIIKPTLDLFKFQSVSTISFLSGCTVLSMSFYSVIRNLINSSIRINIKMSMPLAFGAAIGGVFGKQMFSIIKSLFENADTIGAVQSVCLFIITLLSIIYIVNKYRIRTLQVANTIVCIIIGFLLGLISSFLGIGGGPINLVVLFFFFSMNTKEAACNSLFIILFSQITNLFTTIFTKTIPEFNSVYLLIMVGGGIIGGIVGRIFYKRMNSRAIERLFIILMVVIMGISCYNAYQYL